MRVIVRVRRSNSDDSTGWDYAVVEGVEQFANLALRRIAVLCEQKTVDPRW